MRRFPNINYELASVVVDRIPWFREKLLEWFEQQGRSFPWRDTNRNPYEILVAEVLLPRTTARIYSKFIERYTSWTLLTQTALENLQPSLKPVGLLNEMTFTYKHLHVKL